MAELADTQVSQVFIRCPKCKELIVGTDGSVSIKLLDYQTNDFLCACGTHVRVPMHIWAATHFC